LRVVVLGLVSVCVVIAHWQIALPTLSHAEDFSSKLQTAKQESAVLAPYDARAELHVPSQSTQPSAIRQRALSSTQLCFVTSSRIVAQALIAYNDKDSLFELLPSRSYPMPKFWWRAVLRVAES
jgi:hypothetical protein